LAYFILYILPIPLWITCTYVSTTDIFYIRAMIGDHEFYESNTYRLWFCIWKNYHYTVCSFNDRLSFLWIDIIGYELMMLTFNSCFLLSVYCLSLSKCICILFLLLFIHSKLSSSRTGVHFMPSYHTPDKECENKHFLVALKLWPL